MRSGAWRFAFLGSRSAWGTQILEKARGSVSSAVRSRNYRFLHFTQAGAANSSCHQINFQKYYNIRGAYYALIFCFILLVCDNCIFVHFQKGSVHLQILEKIPRRHTYSLGTVFVFREDKYCNVLISIEFLVICNVLLSF